MKLAISSFFFNNKHQAGNNLNLCKSKKSSRVPHKSRINFNSIINHHSSIKKSPRDVSKKAPIARLRSCPPYSTTTTFSRPSTFPSLPNNTTSYIPALSANKSSRILLLRFFRVITCVPV